MTTTKPNIAAQQEARQTSDDKTTTDNQQYYQQLEERWALLLSGDGDMKDTLFRLENFFSFDENSDKAKELMCQHFSFIELFQILVDTEDSYIKHLCLNILSYVLEYHNPELNELKDESHIDYIYELLMTTTDKQCEEDALFLLCEMIDGNEEDIIPYLIEKGILNDLQRITTNPCYGQILIFLSSIGGDHLHGVLELVSFCFHSDYDINVKNGFITIGKILAFADEQNDEGLQEAVLELLSANIPLIQEQKDGSVVKNIFYVFGMFNEIDVSFSEVVMTMMNNTVNDIFDEKENGVYYGCDIFIHFVESWRGSIPDELFPFLIQIYPQQSYRTRQKIAQVFYLYFPFATEMNYSVGKIFGDFIDNEEIGKDCILAFTTMLSNFPNDPEMSQLLLEYVIKIYDTLESPDDEIVEASSQFIDTFRAIVQK